MMQPGFESFFLSDKISVVFAHIVHLIIAQLFLLNLSIQIKQTNTAHLVLLQPERRKLLLQRFHFTFVLRSSGAFLNSFHSFIEDKIQIRDKQIPC